MRYVLVALLLSGCITPEFRAERMIARFGPICDKLGYEQNTDAWRNCVVQQDVSARGAAAAFGAAQQRRPQTCTAVGNTVQCY